MTTTASAAVGAPGGPAPAAREESIRTLIRANSENFPVGSFLIPPDCRPHVHAFYLFARKADDIADSPTIPAAEKVARLQAASDALGKDEAALPEWAVPYHRSLIETGCATQNGRDLLSAFIQDATKLRYADWDDLMDYCLRSAASVGRVMMDIHGESRQADLEGSDALCNALQVLNHLQDCREDYLALDRVYLPEPWLKEAGGGVEMLAETPGGTGCAPHHRPVPGAHGRPAQARRSDAAHGPPAALPLGVRGDRQAGLGAPSQARQWRPPRRPDQGADAEPRGPRVERHRPGMVSQAVSLPIPEAPDPKRYVAEVTRASGSSFFLPMLLLPREKREAMLALYAFCRETDDVADEIEDPAQSRALIEAWRGEVRALYQGAPRHPVTPSPRRPGRTLRPRRATLHGDT